MPLAQFNLRDIELLEPTVLNAESYHGDPDTGPIPGYLAADILVTSELGESRVDIAGPAFAAAIEPGESYKQQRPE